MIVGAIDCDIPKQRAQNAAQGHYIAVAHTIDMQANKGKAHVGSGDISPTLSKGNGHDTHAVCAIQGNLIGRVEGGPQGVGVSVNKPMYTLTSTDIHAVATPMVVRRLTPVECERLQGFPDGWTDIGTLEKPTADSHRYKQLGNAVTVNVAQWIAQKIEETP
jgi:DNA (cytosine-5)-methyltransferase 1